MKFNCNLQVESFNVSIDVDPLTIFNISVSEWFKRGGDAAFLETHDIHSDSIVVEVGAYTGVWSEKINQKYKPQLFVLEPVSAFRNSLNEKFKDKKNVVVIPYGLGTPGYHKISLSNDGSSLFQNNSSGSEETIEIKSFDEFIKLNDIKQIDLLQINIEGSEYDLFEQIFKNNILNKIKKIQVQFHLSIKDAVEKREFIRKRLLNTHQEILNFPFVWEVWTLK